MNRERIEKGRRMKEKPNASTKVNWEVNYTIMIYFRKKKNETENNRNSYLANCRQSCYTLHVLLHGIHLFLFLYLLRGKVSVDCISCWFLVYFFLASYTSKGVNVNLVHRKAIALCNGKSLVLWLFVYSRIFLCNSFRTHRNGWMILNFLRLMFYKLMTKCE